MAAAATTTEPNGIVVAHPRLPTLGRSYFALQAVAGAVWWALVFTVAPVREATLGGADPRLVAALDLPLFVVASALAAFGLRWACRVAVPWTLLVTAALVVGATLTGRAGWGALAMLAASVGSLAAWSLMTWGRIPAERMLLGPLVARVARSAPPGRQLARTLAQLAVFWVFFLAVLPVVIRWFETRWGLRIAVAPDDVATGIAGVGTVILLAASALGLWAAFTMSLKGDGTPLPSATARRLVVAGPYRRVRNPMALAGIAQAIGAGLMLGSWLVIVYALCGAAYWNWLVRPLEEAELETRFGAEYRGYRAQVRCWIPRRAGPARRLIPLVRDR